jgi:hypothetical protein
MKTFTYVEDYLEVINGDRNPVTGKPYGLFDDTPPIVNLARYDVQILSSMSAATLDGKSLTDKQADLAIKIVLKYRKQLEKLDIDVSPVETPKFRLGIRQIDRRRLVYIENDKIVLKFPYETKLINDIRDLAKISHGSWLFDSGTRAWKLGITETNVVAAHGFAENNNFEVAADFLNYLKVVLDCEQQPYEIKLVEKDNELSITNAPPSLVEAISNWCGFDSSNLDLLVDVAPVYGYKVDSIIENKIINKYSPRIYNIMVSKETKFVPNAPYEVVNDIVRYAKITGRYPIYVYEPDMSDRLLNNFVKQHFEESEIHQVRDLKKESNTIHKKVIYFNKYKANWEQPIPLLISGQGMMHGGEKSLLLQKAEKIVYFATDVYNKNIQK